MVLSIRKISTENDDLTGQGVLWFKNLNEPDPYLLLPAIATILNYINLGVSTPNNTFVAWDHQRKWALVRKSIPIVFPSTLILPSSFHPPMASRRIRVLDQLLLIRASAADNHEATLVPEQNQPQLLLRLQQNVQWTIASWPWKPRG